MEGRINDGKRNACRINRQSYGVRSSGDSIDNILLSGPDPAMGADLLSFYQSGGSGVSEDYLRDVEAAAAADQPPDDPWH